MDAEDFRLVAEQAAKIAGSFLRLMSFKDLQVFRKGDSDVYTNFDIESERLIKNHILMHFPDHFIMAEETPTKFDEFPEGIVWFIDPLDGTKAFLRGNFAFVSLSIAAWDKNGVIAGVVYNPFTDMLYSGARGGKAKLNGSELPPPRVYPLKKARLLVDFSNRLPRKLKRKMAVADLDGEIGRCYRLGGGISQHLMLVAQGTLHGAIFWGAGYKGQFWDIAAAYLILENIGLKTTNLEGQPVHPTDEVFDRLVVAAPPLHREMLEWVARLKQLQE